MIGYLIRARREFAYPKKDQVVYFGEAGWVLELPLIPFATREAAKQAAEEFHIAPYYTGFGEIARPTLRVVQVSAASRDARDRVRTDLKVKK